MQHAKFAHKLMCLLHKSLLEEVNLKDRELKESENLSILETRTR